MNVTLRREDHNPPLPRYIVLLDGKPIGEVYQDNVVHSRGSAKHTYATRQTRSPRWFARPSGGMDWRETRWAAIALVLAAHLDVYPTHVFEMARAAREEKP